MWAVKLCCIWACALLGHFVLPHGACAGCLFWGLAADYELACFPTPFLVGLVLQLMHLLG
jgi:hypothetical protein